MTQESGFEKELYTYAVNLAAAGSYNQAERVLSEAIKDSKPAVEYLLLLGKIYAQQGRYQEAIQQWQKILGIEPENKEAKEAIEKASALFKKHLSPAGLFWRSFLILVIFVLGLSLIYFLGGIKAKRTTEAKLNTAIADREKLLATQQTEVEALKMQLAETETKKDRQRAQVYIKKAKDALTKMQKSWFRKERYLLLAQDYVSLAVKTDPLHKAEYEAILKGIESVALPPEITGNRGFILRSEK